MQQPLLNGNVHHGSLQHRKEGLSQVQGRKNLRILVNIPNVYIMGIFDSCRARLKDQMLDGAGLAVKDDILEKEAFWWF